MNRYDALPLEINDRIALRRTEARRLILLALDLLDDEREQIVQDYLGHA